MKGIFSAELKRSFANRSFLISLIVSLILVIWYALYRLPFCVQHNYQFAKDMMIGNYFEISYTNWLGSHNLYLPQSIYYFIFPFLAVLPFGGSFYSDIQSGTIKNVLIRTKKKSYLMAKYISVFISGGVSAVIPLVVSFLVSTAVLPTMSPESTYYFTNIFSTCRWADLLFTAPILYTLLNISVQFIFAGFLACMSLAVSFYSSKLFLPLLYPFFIYISFSLVCELFGAENYSMRYMLTNTGTDISTASVCLMAFLLFLLSFFPFFIMGLKKEAIQYA